MDFYQTTEGSILKCTVISWTNPQKLNDSLEQKRPESINRQGVVFHQDNGRPHTSLIALLLVASTSTVYSKPAPEPPVNSYFPPPSGPSHSGVSGNYGPPIPDRYGPPQQQPVVHKHVYVHVPPPEAPEYSPPKYIPPASPPQKHYKIVFIKAPTPPTPTAPALPPLPPQDEEKTLIYVLVKKPEEAPDVVLPTQAPTQPSKPEVYFIRYKTQKESQSTEYGPPHQSPPSDNYGSPPSNPGGPY
ncbi:PREDICTED: extensin-3-like [Eufriesea mexicana]|uniref:extensin-3-like n=1 Tax=Eufriesea mexicana TaxID=516756 RepID=UPI00083BF2C4|nr:PREDICTED: extensin-3-like [Eufriesea mexicana]